MNQGTARPTVLFSAIAVGATTAIAILTASKGWTVASPAWGVLAPIAMWAPAFARLVSQRTVDRGFNSTLRLRHWGVTGSRVVLRPLAIPFLVYGAVYAIAWSTGLAHWSPGEGRWTTGAQIAANLVVNLTILGVFGTFTAMGEEIGWRGYLQPRLDAAGLRSSVIVVWLIQVAYHVPLMLGTEYVNVGSFTTSLTIFTIGDLAFTFIAAREAYLARSLWPAVFLHSFHNTISQWLFPKFFTVAAGQLWIQGEDGLLPMAAYTLLGLAMYVSMRRHGQTWAGLWKNAATCNSTTLHNCRIG